MLKKYIKDEILLNSPIVQKAYNFAFEKHKGQKRFGGEDYITHPLRVAKIVSEHKKSKNMEALVCASLLHDTLEDTYTSYKELTDNFGEIIASMVMELTSASFVSKLKGKDVYLAHKMSQMSPYALYIKLADRLDNITDQHGTSKAWQDNYVEQTKYIIEFLNKKNNLTIPQKVLAQKINVFINDYENQETK